MADRLTQLQDCLDDLLTDMYASLRYIYSRHPTAEIEGQPSQAKDVKDTKDKDKDENGTKANANANGDAQDGDKTPPPETKEDFKLGLHELAQHIVLKEQQIEYIINSLPGLGNSQADQEARMTELVQELNEVEVERAQREQEKDKVLDLLSEMIGGVNRVH